MSGPCLSSSVAGRPLRPATRHSLGEPLPHQLADRPRDHQEAPGCPGFGFARMSSLTTCGINSPFGELSPTSRQISHVLRTLTPLNFQCIATLKVPFDLHVLSTPPPFVLSQNQTLRRKFCHGVKAMTSGRFGLFFKDRPRLLIFDQKTDVQRTIQFLLYGPF